MLICVHLAIPCITGYNTESTEENEIERCSATIFPSYEYSLPLNIVGN